MSKLTDLMHSFSLMDLRGFLGKDVIETLIEWTPDGNANLTRKKLISMIMSVHGLDILSNKNFRYELLSRASKNELIEIRDTFLKGTEKEVSNLQELAAIIAKKSWGNNKLSKRLCEMWGVDSNALVKEQDDLSSEELVTNENRFFELFDYQYFIKQRACDYLNSDSIQERMLIHMPTGTGKTKTAMHIITDFLNFKIEKKGLVIWIAHTNELLQQAMETFKNVWSHLGDGEINIYKLWDRRTIDSTNELNGIVFCGLPKLMSIFDSNPDLFKRLCKDCRLIVFDEAHKAAADKTKKIIERLMRMPVGYENRLLIGLSATPGRTTLSSSENNLLSNMFGNRLIHIDSSILNEINKGKLASLNIPAEKNIIKYFQDRKILAKMNVEKLEYDANYTEEEIKILQKNLTSFGFDENDFTVDQLEVIGKNKNRNLAIMQKLRELYVNEIPTIVFACSVKHGQMLSAMLTLEEIPNCLVLGDMNSVDRNKAIKDFKNRENKINIIINYEVLTTGFDAKNIRCVFITRPTKSIVLYSQMLGRGLRGPRMGGNEKCLLIDIEDNIKSFDNEKAFSHFDDYWN